MFAYQTLLAQSTKAVLIHPTELGKCLVTGAAGFLGSHLVKTLLEQGCKVRALIHQNSLALAHDNLELFKASITNSEEIDRALHGIDSIFHSAALIALLGGPGVTKRYYQRAYDVNVVGTKNLLAGAKKNDVSRFIYISSVDVCFDYGYQPNMTEVTPYASNPRTVYQKTKIIAEQAVLESNGQHGLFTCALRPGGIYGPDKNEMLDRFVEALVKGRLVARIGNGTAKLDVTYVGNLVHAAILAALHLGIKSTAQKGTANGQAYFINDGEPLNSFAFFAPIAKELGYTIPRFYLPGSVLLPFLTCAEFIFLKLALADPTLSPHAIKKVVCTHWSSNKKALRELDFEPVKSVQEALAECMDYYRSLAANMVAPRGKQSRPSSS